MMISNFPMKHLSAILLVLATAPAAMAQRVNITSSNGSTVITSSSAGGLVIVNGVVVSGGTGSVVGAGPAVSEERKVDRFTGIRLQAPADVTYTVGGPQRVTVFAPANILPLVITAIEGGQLTISLKGSVTLNGPLKVVASGPDLDSVSASGSGDISLKGTAAPDLRVRVTGSGSVTTAGAAGRLVAKVSGSGSVDAFALKAKVVEAEISGSGSVDAYASVEARADVSGSGSIQIHGQPPRRNVEKSGSGRVTFR